MNNRYIFRKSKSSEVCNSSPGTNPIAANVAYNLLHDVDRPVKYSSRSYQGGKHIHEHLQLGNEDKVQIVRSKMQKSSRKHQSWSRAAYALAIEDPRRLLASDPKSTGTHHVLPKTKHIVMWSLWSFSRCNNQQMLE